MMRSLISTWPRRLALAFLTLVLSFVLVVLWVRSAPTEIWSDPEIVMRVFVLPSVLAALVLGLSTAACSVLPSAQAAATPAASTPPAGPFKAQVVGIQWMNPLVRRDYPTEWQLLWAQGLVKPNADDEVVKERPKKYASVQPVSPIVTNLYKNNSFRSIFFRYNEKFYAPYGDPYVMNPSYFYTVQAQDPKAWRELGGIRVEMAIATTPDLPPEAAAKIVRDALNQEFEFYNVPKISSANTPADVHITTGGASAGFGSLAQAMDYLQAHPSKTVWVMNWDSPEFPNDSSMAENCTLLILAGPAFNTEREPLAWIGRPAVREVKDFETQGTQTRASQAWQAAFVAAAEQGGAPLEKLGHVIHDVGVGDISSERAGRVAHAMMQTVPEMDYLKHSFNTSRLLGDMRAGSAITNLALAVAWTHQKGQPVLVLGSTEPERATAVLVTPPAKARIVDPARDWVRARGNTTAYRPWWGLRKDADWQKMPQGYSE
jgi:hypothetical protein